MTGPDDLLQRLADEEQPLEAVPLLVEVVDWLRPAGEQSARVIARMIELQQALESNPACHARLAKCLQDWLLEATPFQALTSLGILSRRGFRREFADRLYERLNPAPLAMDNIRDVLARLFDHQSDTAWVSAIPDESWVHFLSCLWVSDPDQWPSLRRKLHGDLLYAVEMLSIWVAAEELEPEILRLDARVVTRDSAFVAQQRELAVILRAHEQWLQEEGDRLDDDHARVLLGQCREGLARLRKRMVVKGSSVALTHLLERLDQTLARIELLLDICGYTEPGQRTESAARLLKTLVRATGERNSLGALWRQNSRLLARSVTHNASHHGEHYITETWAEYGRMFASAALGGVIIAAMALLKIQILRQGLGAELEALLVCLNYGLGFMLIHVIGGTVATKQPAMTAASFANAVEQGEYGRARESRLAELLLQVSRSQFIAIAGNVLVAMGLAGLAAWYWPAWQGENLLQGEEPAYLWYRLQPWQSLAVVHAAIAGLWLFVSGLVAGYVDNRSARVELESRLQHHPLLRPWLPVGLRKRVAHYLAENYGALASNFVFGCLLGSTAYLGGWLGLPLDIRHVAFSSAELGMSAGTLWPGPGAWLLGCLFVLLIAAINLWVSFSLALAVALRSRDTRISRFPALARALWRAVRERPASLILPPRAAAAEDDRDAEQTGASGRENGRRLGDSSAQSDHKRQDKESADSSAEAPGGETGAGGSGGTTRGDRRPASS
ncbi:MAG: recombinase [Haliea sp.]|nr:recombinase [Haliea sp.]